MTVQAVGQAADLYRRTADARGIVALVAANAISLVGVLFLGWSLWTILVIYWLENGVVGFWNLPRILLAARRDGPATDSWREAPDDQPRNESRGGRPDETLARAGRSGVRGLPAALPLVLRRSRAALADRDRAGFVTFFLFHYGVFWTVHGVFILNLPSFAEEATGGTPGAQSPAVDIAAVAFGEILWPSVILAAVALFVSHGTSFFVNYLGRAEYLQTTPGRQVFGPYGRVVVLHLAVIFGAIAVASAGAPITALVVLVVLKTLLDLGLHLVAHWVRRRSAAGAR